MISLGFMWLKKNHMKWYSYIDLNTTIKDYVKKSKNLEKLEHAWKPSTLINKHLKVKENMNISFEKS